MAGSAFYWLDVTNTVQTVSIGAGASYIEEAPDRAGLQDAVSLGGVRRRHVGRQQTRISVGIERDISESLRRDLATMVTHLHHGGWVAFAGDTTNIAASFMNASPLPGSSLVIMAGWPFSAPAAPSANIPIGSEVHIEGINPAIGRREVTTLVGPWTPSATGSIQIDDPTRFRYDNDGPPLVRTRDFYPRLMWPAGATLSIARTRLRLHYDHVLTLEVDGGGIAELAEAGT